MRLHGWNSTAFSENVSERFPTADSDEYVPDTDRSDSPVRPHRIREESEPRVELLKKIREKISSGFYNRESVIEDIGYGFAQALDNSL